jgi:SseB protein N-terminal domain/SseB protein C-terminal domain
VGPAELERLLEAAARDPAERPAFTQALLEAEVLVLGRLDGGLVEGPIVGESLQLFHLFDADGAIAPFFTSTWMLDATLQTRPDVDPHQVKLRCRELWMLTRGMRLVLNPHGPYAKVFAPAEIEAYLDGREPGLFTERLQEERTVMVGAAAHLPPDLPAVLARFLVQRPVVEAAHLGWIAHPDGHSGFLMVVRAPDRTQAMEGFGSVAIGDVTGGETLDVLVVPPGRDNPLAKVPPFYVRPAQADVPSARRDRS